MKLKILLLLGLIMFSCNPDSKDPINEDYEKLFPFKGIEKPDISYEEMKAHLCDPELSLDKYEYPGVTTTGANREYTVTLKCVFTEGFNYQSGYVVRYVDENKNMRILGTNRSDKSLTEYLTSGFEKVITFKVQSGFPIYLSVDGIGARNSSIKASISAISADGYISSPILLSEQYQNREGPNRIPEPYCEYIILP